MLPGLRMALAALFAVTLLIGIGFTVIGLLVSARQDGSSALVPANDPWRTVLRPVEERPVTLMTAVIEPAAEPPSGEDARPAGPARESLDGTSVASAPAEAAAPPIPAEDPKPFVEAKPVVEAKLDAPAEVKLKVQPDTRAGTEPVSESKPVAPSPDPAGPAALVVAPVPAAPPVEIGPPVDVAAAPAIEPPARVAPAEPAPPAVAPLPVATALDDAMEVTASIVLPTPSPPPPQPDAAPAPAVDLPVHAALQPAAIPVPPLPVARPVIKPPKQKTRKVAPRAKAKARARTTARAARPASASQQPGTLQSIFGTTTTR